MKTKMKRMKSKLSISALLLSVALIWGCYPGGAEFIDELDIVYTVYAEEFSFVNAGTYSMPDKIVKITSDSSDDPEYVSDEYAVTMLANIESNLALRGWTRVDENPDVEVLPAAWSITTTTISAVWGWGGWWCWYNPWHCGGSMWFPFPVTTSFTTGTFTIDMVDRRNPGTNDSYKVVWHAVMNGLLLDTYNGARVNGAINQSFTQSPYLTIN